MVKSSKIRKSQNSRDLIRNRLLDIAWESKRANYNELGNELVALSDKLEPQNNCSHNWQKIDEDLKDMLIQLEKNMTSKSLDMIEVCLSRIHKLVNERGLEGVNMPERNIFARLFKPSNNVSTQIENKLKDIAAKSNNPDLVKKIHAIRDLLQRQNLSSLSPKWQKIDSLLSDFVDKLASHITNQNINTANVCLEYIDKFVNARAGHSDFYDKYDSDPDEQKLIDCKVKMHEFIDNGNRLVSKRDNYLKSLEATRSSDLNYHALVAEKEACEIQYNDIRNKVRALADQIYAIVTKITGNDIAFYEMLRKELMSPEIYDDLTAVLEFHREKHDGTIEELKRITESRLKGAEPMPTNRHVASSSTMLDVPRTSSKSNTDSITKRPKTREELE